jgi:hypothetical protein
MIMASSREVKIWARIDGTPSVLISDIIKRSNQIKDNDGKLERGWTKEKGYEQVRSLVGDSECASLFHFFPSQKLITIHDF